MPPRYSGWLRNPLALQEVYANRLTASAGERERQLCRRYAVRQGARRDDNRLARCGPRSDRGSDVGLLAVVFFNPVACGEVSRTVFIECRHFRLAALER